MTRTWAGAIALSAMLWPHTGALSHPHVWVTGGADFGVDDQGRMSKLHITWIYDEFASLYLVNYLQVDADGDQILDADDKAKIIADQTNWPDTFAGDSYLYVEGRKRALGKPENADTRILETGQVEVTFERAIAEPFRPGGDNPEAVVKVYDPTFYYEYIVEAAPKIIGEDGHGCTSTRRPVDRENPNLAALQVELSALGQDETPEQQDVGALFADELVLTCD